MKLERTRVLVVGKMGYGTNSRSLADGVRSAGAHVRTIDTTPMEAQLLGRRNWLSVRRHRRLPDNATQQLREALVEAAFFKPHVLIAIKTVLFDQAPLFEIPAFRVHYSFDDASNPRNISPQYLDFESHWDLVATTKRHNVPEIQARGATPFFQWSAFDPALHFVTVPYSARQYEVGFIGASRPDRHRLPSQLAENRLVPAVIYGPRWRRNYPLGVPGVALKGPRMGERFASAANSFKATIVLLNEDNRDTHTCRSFEAPASGNLVLAPRTDEHCILFEDGRDALLYDDEEEAWSAARRALGAPRWAESIAENGWNRVRQSRSTYRDRAVQLLTEIDSQ